MTRMESEDGKLLEIDVMMSWMKTFYAELHIQEQLHSSRASSKNAMLCTSNTTIVVIL